MEEKSSFDWIYENEIEKFYKLWGQSNRRDLNRTPDEWDEKARQCKRHLEGRTAKNVSKTVRRATDTCAYIRSAGILDSKSEVIDIGCGPGRFVCEFARTATYVTGADFSPESIRQAEALALEASLKNVKFVELDFHNADIAAMGWEKKFTLSFSSISPAINSPAMLDRLESLSRKYCFMGNFVYAYDGLAAGAASTIAPGIEYRWPFDSRLCYALLNILWLKGRLPVVRYYTEYANVPTPVDDILLNKTMKMLPAVFHNQKTWDGLRTYYDKRADDDGMVGYTSERRYMWVYWDVTHEGSRQYS